VSDDEKRPTPGSADQGGFDSLRQRAVARALDQGVPWESNVAPLPLDEVRRVIHEIRLHQIELELQNEELVRVQGELTASHERYVDLYDRAPVAYLTLREDGLIREANVTSARLLGVERSTLAGRHFTDFVEPADQDLWHMESRGLIEEGVSRSFEMRMRNADQVVIWGSVELSLIRDEDGEPSIRTVVSDISERKREALARQRLESRLSQAEKVESLGRMAGAIAHRFNNLMAVITGNAEIALEASEPTGEAGEALVDAIGAAREAAGVAGLLLDYLGQGAVERSVQDLSSICDRALPALRGVMPEGIHLETDLPSHGPFVSAGLGQIDRILTNLVVNAGEAVHGGGGSVRMGLRTVPAESLAVDAHYPAGWTPGAGPYACISVMDDGGGFDPRILGRIFDPFSTTKGFGRGLGLPIALGIATAHGGAMGIRSVPGDTTVEVYLPIQAEGAQVDAGGPDPKRPIVSSKGGDDAARGRRRGRAQGGGQNAGAPGIQGPRRQRR